MGIGPIWTAIGLGGRSIIGRECSRGRRPESATGARAGRSLYWRAHGPRRPAPNRALPRAARRHQPVVNVQFDWWLILVGFVLGAGLAWLVLAELHRREDDLAAREREVEAEWIAADMNAHGFPADAEAVGEVLRLHRTYLASIPPSEADLGLQEGEPAEAGETEASEASASPWASGVYAKQAGSASDASKTPN